MARARKAVNAWVRKHRRARTGTPEGAVARTMEQVLPCYFLDGQRWVALAGCLEYGGWRAVLSTVKKGTVFCASEARTTGIEPAADPGEHVWSVAEDDWVFKKGKKRPRDAGVDFDDGVCATPVFTEGVRTCERCQLPLCRWCVNQHWCEKSKVRFT